MRMRKQLPVVTPLKFIDFKNALSLKATGKSDFSRAFSDTIGAKSCYLVSSGRAALCIALQILRHFSNRRDVIIPAYTCPTVPLSVARAGLKIKLCDISLQTFNLDIDLLSQIADDNTLCIVATHLFGFPCDMGRVMEIAQRTGSFVVEDAAQALGAKYKGKMIGSFGDMSCFSLNRGKNFTTYEGGILAVNKVEYADKIKQMLNDLEKPGVVHKIFTFIKLLGMHIFSRPGAWWLISKLPLGFEPQYHSMDFKLAQLSDWQASFALSVLERLDSINYARIDNARYLMKHLQDLDGVLLPKALDESEPVYLRFPIIIKDAELRNRIHDELHQQGISASKMYIKSLNHYDYLKGIVPETECPKAEYVADRILTVPTHPLVTKDDLKLIVDTFRRFF